MSFLRRRTTEVNQGDIVIVPYMPMFQPRGIVATRVTKVYRSGFIYKNLPMGVEWEVDEEEKIFGLPKEFRPPLDIDDVYRLDLIHITKEQESLLPTLSQHPNYLRSLNGLKDLDRMMTEEELKRALEV